MQTKNKKNARKTEFFLKLFSFLNFYCTFAPAFANERYCPDGGIGRRVGLKHQWGKTRTGSTPVLGTRRREFLSPFLFPPPYIKGKFHQALGCSENL